MAPKNMTSKSPWYDDHRHHYEHLQENEELFSGRKKKSSGTKQRSRRDEQGYHVGDYYIPRTHTGTVEAVPTRPNRGASTEQLGSSRDESDWDFYADLSPESEYRKSVANKSPPMRQSAKPRADSFFSNYSVLLKEKPYRHAQNAGVLWQTLVGQHVRFPSHWWDGARSPSMGIQQESDYYSDESSRYLSTPQKSSRRFYQYIARHRLYDNPIFNGLVRNRSSAGKLLLHVVVRDSQTGRAIQDVALGCLHPNARGIRTTQRPEESEECCREVWMATRKRLPPHEDEVSSIIDPLLTRGRDISELANDSPLGCKSMVTNRNMRQVFGEKPPMQTVCITEVVLNDIMLEAEEEDAFAAPALVLLREYLYP